MNRQDSSVISVRRFSEDFDGREETEIAAQIIVPPDGGWGWVVVITGSIVMFIVDGIVYTFGSLLPFAAREFNTSVSSTSIISALSLGMYLMTGPIVSALINRYGFRAIAMTGSIISSFSVFSSFFIKSFPMVCFLYGFIGGVGYCFIQLSSNLVVGFYFERKRALAMSLLMTGASLGMMILSPTNSFIAQASGWRTVTMMQAGILGLTYFLSMTYRPILSLTVVPAPTSVSDIGLAQAYLPSIAKIKSVKSVGKIKSLKSIARVKSALGQDSQLYLATKTEQLFKAVNNENFPTALDVVNDVPLHVIDPEADAGPSHLGHSRMTLVAQSPDSVMTRQQMDQLKKIMSKSAMILKSGIDLHVSHAALTEKKKGCCGRLFDWEPHVKHIRPMYRDDAFYQGSIKNLPEYRKSLANIAANEQTGFEYQLAVSRAATLADIKEKRGVFTTATRRVLATMLEPSLLKKKSFILLSTCGVLSYMGFLIPFIFVQDRAKVAGSDPQLCQFLVSAISVSVLVGRIVIGVLSLYVDPTLIFVVNLLMCGISMLVSNISNNIYYQYGTSCMFGFFGSSVQALRSVVLVKMYGLSKLTNSIGMLLLFCGIGSLSGPPIASAIKNLVGYNGAFYFAGTTMTLAGIAMCFGRLANIKENIGTELEVKSKKKKKGKKTDEFVKPDEDPSKSDPVKTRKITIIEDKSHTALHNE